MTPTDQAREIRAMFDRIARRYDLMNALMTGGRDQAWRRQAARRARPEAPGGLALDVATGTGDLARALLDEAPVRGVVGLDFSEAMLALGQAKARRDRLERLHFVAADALALPFPDRTFACVTSAFLLRNLTDLDGGLREMARVTHRGGRVVALETSQPTLPGFRSLFALYFNRLVPFLGGLVSGDREAYRYLPRTAGGFLAPDDLVRAMSRAGLGEVVYRRLALGTVAIHVGTVK